MKAKDLKNSILQLAIQGKLVEQNPNDEPASVLLEKIKDEKEKLIKQKKIKREKQLSEISEEEKPFEIPESWEWIRLSEIAWLGDGRKIENVNLPYLEVKYLRGFKEAEIKNKGKFIEKGELVILVDGENSGEVFIIGENGYLGSTFKVLNYTKEIDWEYLMWLLRCYQDKFKNNKTGSAIPHLNKTLFKSLSIGLPPMEEQKRIVKKIEELLPKIEEYNNAEKELTKLEKAFPQDMKKSILQYAMQGKLVEQNINDEPAYVLLEKIKAEKEKLIKEKKIKREKPLPEISEEEKPFEISDTWEWVRLGDIIQLISGQDMTTSDYNDNENGIPYITGASNIDNQKLIINRWTEVARAIAIKNDILLSCKGTVGKTVIQMEEQVHIARQIMAIRCGNFLSNKYVKYFIDSYVTNLKANAKSMIPGIARNDVLNIIFPLPPLEEQERIVDKIEKIMNYIDRLQDKINNENAISKMVQVKSIEIEDSKELINN